MHMHAQANVTVTGSSHVECKYCSIETTDVHPAVPCTSGGVVVPAAAERLLHT
jgi:hypothetical protein